MTQASPAEELAGVADEGLETRQLSQTKNLPVEISRNIYKELLSAKNVRQCANEKMICVYKFEPAILATSKQIHKVAWPILYLENRFIVASCVWNGIFTSMENNQVAAIACTKPNSVARFSVRIPPW